MLGSVAAREVRLSGRVVEDAQPGVPSIHFGRKAAGTKAKETLTFRSLTGRPFKVLATHVTSDDLRISEQADIGTSYSIEISFTKTGDVEAEARFEVEDAKGRRFRLAVPVRYFGS